MRDVQHGALRNRRDRQQRVHAERSRNDGAVDHVQAGMDGTRILIRRTIEHAPGMIDDAGRTVRAHRAAAERMRRRRLIAHEAAGQRILHVAAADFANKRGATETVSLNREDGGWKVVGIYIE